MGRLDDWAMRSRGALLCALPTEREKRLHRKIVVLARVIDIVAARSGAGWYWKGYRDAIEHLKQGGHLDAVEHLENPS